MLRSSVIQTLVGISTQHSFFSRNQDSCSGGGRGGGLGETLLTFRDGKGHILLRFRPGVLAGHGDHVQSKPCLMPQGPQVTLLVANQELVWKEGLGVLPPPSSLCYWLARAPLSGGWPAHLHLKSQEPAARSTLLGCQSRLRTVERMGFLMCLHTHLHTWVEKAGRWVMWTAVSWGQSTDDRHLSDHSRQRCPGFLLR